MTTEHQSCFIKCGIKHGDEIHNPNPTLTKNYNIQLGNKIKVTYQPHHWMKLAQCYIIFWRDYITVFP